MNRRKAQKHLQRASELLYGSSMLPDHSFGVWGLPQLPSWLSRLAPAPEPAPEPAGISVSQADAQAQALTVPDRQLLTRERLIKIMQSTNSPRYFTVEWHKKNRDGLYGTYEHKASFDVCKRDDGVSFMVHENGIIGSENSGVVVDPRGSEDERNEKLDDFIEFLHSLMGDENIPEESKPYFSDSRNKPRLFFWEVDQSDVEQFRLDDDRRRITLPERVFQIGPTRRTRHGKTRGIH